jgi:hypothetical protein
VAAKTLVDIYNDYYEDEDTPAQVFIARIQAIPHSNFPRVTYDEDGQEDVTGGLDSNTISTVRAVAYASRDDRDVFDAFMNLVKAALPDLPAM